MYELVQVSEDCYYIESPAKIGLVKTGDDEVCLIDSGNDKDAGKKVKKILDANSWKLTAIYNTHSHADHIGGNRYLAVQTGCRIYAPGIECSFTRHPLLEPSFLYGGYPPSELRHKFLMAKESDAILLDEHALPDGWVMMPLPGHSFDMVGFRTQDDIVYLADCLASAETLKKYQISFIVDVEAYLSTLEAVKAMKARLFIPAHAEPAEDVSELAELNIAKVHEIADKIAGICKASAVFDDILKGIFDDYGLEMTFEQHALVGSTVRSYLAWLEGSGRVRSEISDNRLIWTAV
ncbi:MAG: MBL fold metallo-hydrolase [Eubacterium sp.]|nr:MBL fold metallo-hydrolase [Eubacterium sp.]